MSDRVDATITIGGPVPADRLEDLLQTIEAEDLGPDWDERFESRQDLMDHLKAGACGAALYAHEVANGEFDALQAFCVEVGLSYVLTYDGCGCQWGPGRRIRRPGDGDYGVTCSLDVAGGNACISADDIRRLELDDLEAVLGYLRRFDDPKVPPLAIEPGVGPPV